MVTERSDEARTLPDSAAAHSAALLAVEDGIEQLVQAVRLRWKDLAHQIHPDLQPIGFRIIAALYGGGPQRAKDLADRLGSDKSVLSRQLSQLEKLDLVERHVDPDDGRIIRMALTEATGQRIRDLESGDGAGYRQALSTWPTQRLRDFAEMLQDFTSPADYHS
ncbi:MarR family winged helix-turn-helix transcriptional regulator [Gordonia sp. VNQ95]|uniref:MarR family winged helix-turn-helix transcriptional regulator n=1 Tax=Gordonia sp. VNQ95 TaxID=3156619 RepID=UPI0032B5076B